jgi:hypothetical protein
LLKSTEHRDEKEVNFLLTETLETLLIETVDFALVRVGFCRVGVVDVLFGEISAEMTDFREVVGLDSGAEI